MTLQRLLVSLLLCVTTLAALAQPTQTVVDIPSRPGVTERLLVVSPPAARGSVLLLAGGHGGLQIQSGGGMKWGEGNFVVRTRRPFADRGLRVAVLDAPSDRQTAPFLAGFRQTPEHVADIRAAIAWLRSQGPGPVWLVATSRGTQSAAHAAIELADAGGPDGLVLTSTILSDSRGRPVPAMALERLRIPVLVVHHDQDGCSHCAPADLPALTGRLSGASRSETMMVSGGESRGDPCEAFAFHGFNGIEAEVVGRIVDWMQLP